MKKLLLCSVLFILFPQFISGQQHELKGIVVNGKTGAPIENVNLRVRNSPSGTSTDKKGIFKLDYGILPVIVEITCIGFEPISIDITKVVDIPVEISLQPLVYPIEGFILTEKKGIPVFDDKSYSVLDYELMGDNILLLAFRNQLKRSELLLITRIGDTLAFSDLPDQPPSKLYKDPLGCVHYFSKNGNAYQCYYNKSVNQIQFIYKNTADKVLNTFTGFQFVMKKHLFFQESTSNGFSSQIGYIDNEHGKKYLLLADNRKLAKDYYSDLNFFMEPRRPGDSFLAGENMRAFELFYKPKSDARIVKAGSERIAVFDFTNDTLLLLNPDWNLLSTTTFSFHKEIKTNFMTSVFNSFSGNTWKWRWNIYSDEYSGKVYTDFERQGQRKLCEIDLNNGTLLNEYIIPVLFVQKIIIYKGEAFFLYKPIGEYEKWRLYKMRLQ